MFQCLKKENLLLLNLLRVKSTKFAATTELFPYISVVGMTTIDFKVRVSNFSTSSKHLALGPNQPPIYWVPMFFPGDKAAGA